MAEVPLSDYCDEAKELIRTDSYNRAIAICRHILKHYPKYLRAYRLLGEACLEKGDYVEAANLFKRVLGVDMEDMVVYVGLGIIFDEQGAMDEAIWQLERAFEMSPGNGEIRKELQRLYGERDETAPTRLKLTPAALGRLYLREELYQRAIDEFRGVLEEDPDRPDVQISLAQALWCIDQRQDAAEVCEAILEKYPHCLKANLILGEILASSDRQAEGRTLLETAQAMDPENVVAQELLRDRSPLRPATVTIPRLDDKGLEQETEEISSEMPSPSRSAEPGAAASAALPRIGGDEAMPDWLRRLQEEEKGSAAGAGGTTSPPETHEMPSWLRELAEEGDTESSGEPEPTHEGPPAGEEGVPSWLADMGEPAEEEARPDEPAADAEMTPPSEETAGAVPDLEPSAERTEEELLPSDEAPDWLAQLRAETASGEEASPGGEEQEASDWLGSLRATVTEDQASPEPEEDVPAWTRHVRDEAAEEEAGAARVEEREEMPPDEHAGTVAAVALEQERAPVEEELDISEGAMDRLRESMPDESASIDEIIAWMEKSKALLAEEGVPEIAMEDELAALPRKSASLLGAEEEGETPTWLQELTPKAEEGEQAVLADEPEPDYEEPAVPISEEEIPTWLRELKPDVAEGVTPTPEEGQEVALGEQPAAREEEASTASEEHAPATQEPAAPPVEEVPSWLIDLRAEAAAEESPVAAAKPGRPTEEAPEPPSEGEMPPWLRQLQERAAREEMPGPSQEPEAAPPVATEEKGSPIGEPPPEMVDEEAVVVTPEEEGMPSWLRQLRAEATREEPSPLVEEQEPAVEEVTLPAPPEEEDMPSWLRQLRAEAAREEPAVLPDEPESPAEEEPESHVVEAELPSWLQELKTEVARDGIPSLTEETEPSAAAEPVERAEQAETPSWLRELRPEEPGPRGVTPEASEHPAEEMPPSPLEEEEDVPSWLSDMRTQADEGDTGTLRREAEAAAGEVPLQSPGEEELPSWLRELRGTDVTTAPAAEGEAPLGELAVEELTQHPEAEEEPIAEQQGPPTPPRGGPVAPETPAGEDQGPAAPSGEGPPEATPQPGWALKDYLRHLESNPRDHTSRLALARAYSQAGHLDQAAKQYGVILSYGSLVEEVVDDLEATTEAAPEHMPTHELLADAYMRSGQLQKALDKYRWLRVMLAR